MAINATDIPVPQVNIGDLAVTRVAEAPLRARVDAVFAPTSDRGKAIAEADRLQNLGKQKLTMRQRLEQAAHAPVPESAQEFQGKIKRFDSVSKTLETYATKSPPDTTAAEAKSRLDGNVTLMKSAEIYRMMPPDGNLDETTPAGQVEIKKIAGYVGIEVVAGGTARPDADIKKDIMALADGGMSNLRASGIGQLLLNEYDGDQDVTDAVLESLMRDPSFRESIHQQTDSILLSTINLEVKSSTANASGVYPMILDQVKLGGLNDGAYHVGNNGLYRVLDTHLKSADNGMARELAKTENAGRETVNKRWRETETLDSDAVRENLSLDVRTATDMREGDLGLRVVIGRSLGIPGINAINSQDAYDALDDKSRAQIEGVYKTHGEQIKADLWVNLSKNIGFRDRFKLLGRDLHFSDKEWEQNAEYFSTVTEKIVQNNPQARALLKKVEQRGQMMPKKKRLMLIALMTILAIGGIAMTPVGLGAAALGSTALGGAAMAGEAGYI
ncbi:MAG: hypothetical protein NUV65_02930 [Candidatus Roizmanbacteria bacterium]|nr:hypothetical protein [Candidatus Roizmanbacteria bacterium]